VSSVTRVPEIRSLSGEELTARDAWQAVRKGRWGMYAEALTRFRYGDGFSHSRALGLQLCLAFIPLVIAVIGLSSTLQTDRMGEVLRLTLLSLTPGASDEMVRATLARPEEGDGPQVALWLGLLFALVSLTSAMGQVERGANRIYGIQRDRPTVHKYGRAAVLAVAAGVPAVTGFIVLIAGTTFGEAVEQVYDLDDDIVSTVALPLGVVLLFVSITAMLRHTPRRRQPGWSWLSLGAGVALVLWLVFTGLLVGYVQLSDSFGTVYGPLTGIVALLLWAQLTSVAIFLGLALSAQLEAVHAGIGQAAVTDPDAAGEPHDGRMRVGTT
jgi:YihY family inner membrane protein